MYLGEFVRYVHVSINGGKKTKKNVIKNAYFVFGGKDKKIMNAETIIKEYLISINEKKFPNDEKNKFRIEFNENCNLDNLSNPLIPSSHAPHHDSSISNQNNEQNDFTSENKNEKEDFVSLFHGDTVFHCFWVHHFGENKVISWEQFSSALVQAFVEIHKVEREKAVFLAEKSKLFFQVSLYNTIDLESILKTMNRSNFIDFLEKFL